jgi:signal transduction histidine kinase/ligand-binding sensor domain-containing protein
MNRSFTKPLALLAVCILSLRPLQAQQSDLRVERLTVSDGLTENSMYCALQDYLGFMWFGTENGLHRYDGYGFKVYQPDATDSTSIKGRAIFSLHEDRGGRLWVGTESGLSRYLRERDIFKNYKLKPDWATTDTSDATVQTIFDDGSGNLLLGFRNHHVALFDPVSESLRSGDKFDEVFERADEISLADSDSDGIYDQTVRFPEWAYGETLHFKYVLRYHNGSIVWEHRPNPDRSVAYGNRTLQLSGGDIDLPTVDFHMPGEAVTVQVPRMRRAARGIDLSTSVHFKVNTRILPGFNRRLDSVEVRGNLFPLNWSGRRIYMLKGSGPFEWLTPETDASWSAIAKDSKGDVWVSPDQYMWVGAGGVKRAFIKRLNPTTGQVRRYSDFAMSMGSLTAVVADRSGLVWTGIVNEGILKLDPRSQQFPRYVTPPSDSRGFYGLYINAICEDDEGEIWLGGDMAGVYRFNRTNGKYTLFGPRIPADSLSLSGAWVGGIHKDRKGDVWIATFGGLDKFDTRTKRFRHFFLDPSDGFSGVNSFHEIYEDSSGGLWFGNSAGSLYRFDPLAEKFTQVGKYERNPEWYAGAIMARIVSDDNGIFWIGAAGGRGAGLLRFDPATGLIRGHKKDASDRRFVTSLCLDHRGRLWYGTLAQGLFCFDRGTETETNITERDGLLHNSVMGIEEDNHGNLWLSSQRGLTRYNPEKGTFHHYFKEDGLQSNDFRYWSYFKSRSGELFFGGQYGFNAFYPDSIKESDYIPPIVLTDITVNHEPVSTGKDSPLEKHISVADRLTLSHQQNNITLTFAALDYAFPQRNLYSYKLENYDKEWSEPANARTAVYTNLDHGEYVFRVKGSNRDGVWNESGTALTIVIRPAYWQTWWFKGLLLLALIGSVATVVGYSERVKANRKIERLERERAVERERARISQDMHDEVGSSLSEISILSELVKRDLRKPDQAEVQVQQISERAAELIDNVSEIVWAMNPKNDTLDNLLAHVRRYAVKYLNLVGIPCDFVAPENVPSSAVSSEVRRNFFLVVKEALHNIVKHASASTVEIKAEVSEGKMRLQIRDNGKGFVPGSGKGEGNGLLNMRKRMADIGGEMQLESVPGSGTSISATLPL